MTQRVKGEARQLLGLFFQGRLPHLLLLVLRDTAAIGCLLVLFDAALAGLQGWRLSEAAGPGVWQAGWSSPALRLLALLVGLALGSLATSRFGGRRRLVRSALTTVLLMVLSLGSAAYLGLTWTFGLLVAVSVFMAMYLGYRLSFYP